MPGSLNTYIIKCCGSILHSTSYRITKLMILLKFRMRNSPLQYGVKWLLTLTLSLVFPESRGLIREPLPLPERPYFLGVDQPGNRYLVINQTTIFEMHSDSTNWTRRPLLLRDSDGVPDIHDLILRSNGTTTYIAHWSGGLVYELKGDSLVRIDQSYLMHTQHGSSKWLMNDTLVSFGGYGLWNYQNFFSFYSPAKPAWDILPTDYEKTPVPGVWFHGNHWFDASQRMLFLVGDVPQLNSARQPYFSQKKPIVWSYNFNTDRWRRLGNVLVGQNLFTWRQFISLDDKLIIFTPYGFNELDFYNNRIREHTFNSLLGHRLDFDATADYNPATGEVIYVSNEIQGRIHIRPLEMFYSGTVKENILYRNYWKLAFRLFIALLFLGVAVILYQIYRKRCRANTPVYCNLKEGFIRYKSKEVGLDKGELKLLGLLASEDRYFDNQEIFEAIANGLDSPDLLKKQKAHIMASLNNKVSILRGQDIDLFDTRKGTEDKRLVEVSLKSGLLNFQ